MHNSRPRRSEPEEQTATQARGQLARQWEAERAEAERRQPIDPVAVPQKGRESWPERVDSLGTEAVGAVLPALRVVLRLALAVALIYFTILAIRSR